MIIYKRLIENLLFVFGTIITSSLVLVASTVWAQHPLSQQFTNILSIDAPSSASEGHTPTETTLSTNNGIELKASEGLRLASSFVDRTPSLQSLDEILAQQKPSPVSFQCEDPDQTPSFEQFFALNAY